MEKLKKYLHKKYGWFDCAFWWQKVDKITASDINEQGGWWEKVKGHCEVCGKKTSIHTTACPDTSAVLIGFTPAYMGARCWRKDHTREEALKFIKENNIKLNP